MLWKADVDAAFRRVPLHPYDRWAAAIAFKQGGQVTILHCDPTDVSARVLRGQVWVSEHYACPFGAAGSVCVGKSRPLALLDCKSASAPGSLPLCG